ncbi:MAG: hypothetical protein JXB40_01660 [Candidatus Omnitrophica bacterium]|nr:hypothetical protein [Candidatus Omnitrophota bacterium]
MRDLKVVGICCVSVIMALILAGCGVPKDKYEAVLNEKIILEEKVNVLTKAKDALKNEYDALLNEKMDLDSKVETLTSEKEALKEEYDKLLDEKIALKAAYDKLLADNKIVEESLVAQ